HLKFDEYVPLESEQVMRSYSTAMIGSKPSSNAASTPSSSKRTQSEIPIVTPSIPSTAPRNESPTRQRAPPVSTSSTRGRFVQINSSAEPTLPDFAYGIIHLYKDVT